MLSDARFREGVKILGRRQLSFDAMLYHQQIDDLTRLAEAAENTQIIVDHIGCPIGVGPYRGKESETLRAWRTSIIELARCANVALKFGGLGMIILGAEHHLADVPPDSERLANQWRPYFETCVDAFGSERCLFESNFPVDKGMFSYPVVWNAFKRLTATASQSEKANLFSNTAARLYRLPLPSITY
jgi:predicted TIM-barrel fold metal-dependent hydrolase